MRLPPKRYEVYIDGASHGNPGPAGVGVVFREIAAPGEQGTVAREFSRYIGETTNNVAEYLALVYALQEALLAGIQSLTIKTDSELLAHQVNGRYAVRNGQLRLFHDLVLHLVGGLRAWSIEHIPRTQNTAADRLAGQAVKHAPCLPASRQQR